MDSWRVDGLFFYIYCVRRVRTKSVTVVCFERFGYFGCFGFFSLTWCGYRGFCQPGSKRAITSASCFSPPGRVTKNRCRRSISLMHRVSFLCVCSIALMPCCKSVYAPFGPIASPCPPSSSPAPGSFLSIFAPHVQPLPFLTHIIALLWSPFIFFFRFVLPFRSNLSSVVFRISRV